MVGFTQKLKGPGFAMLTLAALMSACVNTRTMTIEGYGGAGVASDGTSGSQALATAPSASDPLQVRAPEIFSASAMARWNGSRTARGVWVAHPEVTAPMQVRIVNAKQKLEVDGIVYRQRGPDVGDVLTVSSDAAAALGMRPDQPAQLTIFALKPAGQDNREQRRSVEGRAQAELASHIARLSENDLLQLVAAAMRGMGYATSFAPVSPASDRPAIQAYPRPDGGVNLPSIRIAVRPGGTQKMTAVELSALQAEVATTGDLGIVVSAAGFAPQAELGIASGGTHMELVDLDGLMNIWITHYEQLSEPDRALLRLQPVYFLAGG